ncbi:ABC transporter ATP-binding protein [Hydrogenophaga sp.]|uniref:ABC transporter ATP-binding protein n=1 Tax=Hydrogenophaga sp. TaxID=1904254 RepID=UPI00356AAD1A
MLEVRQLTAGYGRFSVLGGIDFTVPEGTFVGIIGRNGVGKTTLLKTLAGAVKPSTGTVQFRGKNIIGQDAMQVSRQGISLVLDRKGIFASLSVLENLQLAQRLGAQREKRWSLDDVLGMFPRLAERIKAPGGGLSGGEQQMLAIARALLTQPSLLLLDEPTEGLAPKIVDELVGLFQRLAETGLTAIVVDQRLETVFDTCGEVLLMSRGDIAERSNSKDLRNNGELLAQHLGV